MVKTFRDNIGKYRRAVSAIKTEVASAGRFEIEPSEMDNIHPHISEVFSIEGVPVKRVVVNRIPGQGTFVDFVLYSSGLSVAGRSWIIYYDEQPSVRKDPAVVTLVSCDRVNLHRIVERDRAVLRAECDLMENWKLIYSSN